jgi:hypothetical protein
MKLSEYLTESILTKERGIYNNNSIIPAEGEVEDEFEYTVGALESRGTRRFYASKNSSFLSIIHTRTMCFPKASADQIEFCEYLNVWRCIVVIGKGPMERGKKACALLYGFSGKDKGKLVNAYFYEYDGSKWTLTNKSSHKVVRPLTRNLVKEINGVVDS